MWTDEGDTVTSAGTVALTQARGRSVIAVMDNTPETCANVRGVVFTMLLCMYSVGRSMCVAVHLYVCMSVCLQFARSLVERGYPKVCCVQGGAQRLRSLGLLASVGKDP